MFWRSSLFVEKSDCVIQQHRCTNDPKGVIFSVVAAEAFHNELNILRRNDPSNPGAGLSNRIK
jgi:hypothetical protein